MNFSCYPWLCSLCLWVLLEFWPNSSYFLKTWYRKKGVAVCLCLGHIVSAPSFPLQNILQLRNLPLTLVEENTSYVLYEALFVEGAQDPGLANQMYPSQIWITRFPSSFLFLPCQFLGVWIREALAPVSEQRVRNGQDLYGSHLLQPVGFLRKSAAGGRCIWSSLGNESCCRSRCHRWCCRLFKHHRAAPLKALPDKTREGLFPSSTWINKESGCLIGRQFCTSTNTLSGLYKAAPPMSSKWSL